MGEICYVQKQRAVTINPNKICQPIGAMWATLGVHRGIPFVQGSQGCCTYVRYTFNRHFREPVTIAVASFHEHAAVYGGMKNLVEGVFNLVARYDPDLIAVITTCSSETIGDDIEAFIRAAKKKIAKELGEEKAQLPVIPVHCPSYQGSHVTGYDNASKAFLGHLAKKDEGSEKIINVIPGFGVNPGDIEEIKRILNIFGLKEKKDYSILFDISETLYQPLREPIRELPYYPKGGTLVEEFVDAANAKATFALCQHAGGSGALYLKNRFGVEAYFGLPIGIKNTDDFIINLAKVTGLEIPDRLLDERGRLIDAIVDTVHYTKDVRVGIFGDPDFVIAITRFCCEMGLKPIVVNTQTPSKVYRQEMEKIAKEFDVSFEVQFSDLWDFEKSVKEKGVDLLIGHPRGGAKLAEELGIGLVRIGFPIYDRVGHFRWPIVGYMGSLRLFDEIVNTILDTRIPWDQKQQ